MWACAFFYFVLLTTLKFNKKIIDFYLFVLLQCSEQCGHGMQTRQIYCGSFDGVIYKSDHCEEQPKPKNMKSCESSATCNAEWHASKWSEVRYWDF